MVTALIFPHATPALVRAHVPAGARVVAVDAGADVALAAGVRPDVVVGDMDSVAPETLAALEKAGVSLERHPAAKRDSDGALALRHATAGDDIIFVGMGGGPRPDHALANLHLLARAGATASARAVDEDARTWVATPARALRLDLPAGTLVSVIPFGGDASGVTLVGFRWTLRDATMATGDPYGLSNETIAPPQHVSLERGTLLVIAPQTPRR